MTDAFAEIDPPEPPPVSPQEAAAIDQSDIDALFDDIGAPQPASSGVRALVESTVVNQERLPMLEVVCDRVVRSFATNMRHLTTDAIDVSLEEVSSGRFGELMNRVALPAMFGVFRIDEWDNYGVIVVEPNLIYSIVDALLGGRTGGSQPQRVEGRAFTTIETALVARMMERALADLAAAFEPVAPINIALERIEISPRFASIAGPSNVTATCAFRVEMEGRGGKFLIFLPHTTLEPVKDKLFQRFMGEKLGRDTLWEAHMERELRKIEIRLDAVLASREFPLGTVRALAVGDTLPLGVGADTPLALYHGKVRLGLAQLGQRNVAIAVRLLNDIGTITP